MINVTSNSLLGSCSRFLENVKVYIVQSCVQQVECRRHHAIKALSLQSSNLRNQKKKKRVTDKGNRANFSEIKAPYRQVQKVFLAGSRVWLYFMNVSQGHEIKEKNTIFASCTASQYEIIPVLGCAHYQFL